MCSTYKLVDPKGELLASADTIGYLDGLVAHLPPGRYTVNEIRDEPGPIGLVSRRWGAIRRFEDGTVLLELDPWEAEPGLEAKPPPRGPMASS